MPVIFRVCRVATGKEPVAPKRLVTAAGLKSVWLTQGRILGPEWGLGLKPVLVRMLYLTHCICLRPNVDGIFSRHNELASGNMLDFRVMVTKYPSLNLKAGQWKAHFNRERVISSGKQQMTERSLITRPFTIDRQQGVSLYGSLSDGGLADFNYWVAVFTGMGRGAGANDDDNMMYMARAQWNFLGRELKFSGSDIPYSEEAAGLIALAAVTNRSPYTRFSTAGGGQLEGFEDGEPGQYRVNQWMVETDFKYKGFSWQQEYHWKEINDRINESVTTLTGNYMQFGYFFHYLLEGIPKQLELAFRHAFYKPDMDNPDNAEHEYSFAANWFFKGHLNKLTAEISYFESRELSENRVDGIRFRIQWDISI